MIEDEIKFHFYIEFNVCFEIQYNTLQYFIFKIVLHPAGCDHLVQNTNVKMCLLTLVLLKHFAFSTQHSIAAGVKYFRPKMKVMDGFSCINLKLQP